MRETLYDANGRDETRVRRAFSWVVTFRDFPEGSRQTVDGDSMMTEALTLFTKGRAEFYLDGVKRGDRVPGILSSEHEVVGQGGTFEIRYVEPTTRLCIPRNINRNELPTVTKYVLEEGETLFVSAGDRFLVCLGQIVVNDHFIPEERTFTVTGDRTLLATDKTILLKFHAR